MTTTASPSTRARLFRVAAIAEACSWAGLLVGMFVKYVVVYDDIGVQIFGPVHGALLTPEITKHRAAFDHRVRTDHRGWVLKPARTSSSTGPTEPPSRVAVVAATRRVGEDDAMSVVAEDLHFPHGAVLIGNTLVVAETFGITLTAFDGDDGVPGSAG